MSEEQQESARIAHELVADVVASMVCDNNEAKASPFRCRHSPTLLRVVHELSSKHEIVFESITRKLQVQVNGRRDTEICRKTFVGVVDELFADGCYNWGRVVTVFAYAGWLARACEAPSSDSLEINGRLWQDTVVDVAGEYIGSKLAGWVSKQGGWVYTLRLLFVYLFVCYLNVIRWVIKSKLILKII